MVKEHVSRRLNVTTLRIISIVAGVITILFGIVYRISKECIIGSLGLVIAFYFGMLADIYQSENKQLNEEKRRLSWSDLQSLARELKQKICQNYKPQIYFSPCRRGTTVANLMFYPDENVPLYVGIREDKRGTPQLNIDKKNFEVISTGKYNHYIPISLLEKKDSKLLIIDDFAESGDSLLAIVKYLTDNGFNKANIRTATVVCSKAAINAKKEPDFYSTTMINDFIFPWGPAR